MSGMRRSNFAGNVLVVIVQLEAAQLNPIIGVWGRGGKVYGCRGGMGGVEVMFRLSLPVTRTCASDGVWVSWRSVRLNRVAYVCVCLYRVVPSVFTPVRV
jgi:hypothetical protein